MILLPRLRVCRTLAVAFVLLRLMADVQAVENPDDTATAELIDLLVSDRPAEQAKGESLLAAQRSSLIAGQLQRILSPDVSTSGKAAYTLGILISPWLRGVEAGHRSYTSPIPTLRRPVDKVPQLAEAPAIRQCLQTAITALLDGITDESMRNYPKEAALQALCETLGEVANDDTITWSINQSQKIKSHAWANPLSKLFTAQMHIPLYATISIGICGNSPPEEIEKLRLEEAALIAADQPKLPTWQEFRPLGTNERTTFAIKIWRERLLPNPEAPNLNFDDYPSEWLSRMEPLIRLGAPAVEALRAQQRLETNAAMKGIWEVVIAAITGHEDAELVRCSDPKLACAIIAAAASKQWLPKLEDLQIHYLDANGIVSETIAISHGCEGIPTLRKGVEADPDNIVAKGCLYELEARAKNGPPKGRPRYFFQ